MRSALCAALAVIVAGACLTALLYGGSGAAENEPESRAEFAVSGTGTPSGERPMLRAGRDPLTADEIGYAIWLATRDSSLVDATDVRGRAGLEVLYVDLPPGSTDAHVRRAVVVAYDYTSDTTIQYDVDLDAGRIRETLRSPEVQPPPSQDEAEAAITLAVHAEPSLRFRAEFAASEGAPLTDPRQVTYTAGTFVYDGTTRLGQTCGRDRCIQLLISTPAGTYLDTTDFVVNLSEHTIVVLGG